MAADKTKSTAVRDTPNPCETRSRGFREDRLNEAKLYVCTDARRDRGDLAEFLDAAYAGGADIIQLRDKGLEARAEIDALMVLREAALRHGKLFSVNDRADVALLVDADVFHVGQGDLSSAQARTVLGPDVILGRSAHSIEQAKAAAADAEVDYLCLGPVWETPTKPGRAAIGVEPLREFAAEVSRPWFAIGGISYGDRLAEVTAAGAGRIVVVRAVTEADDPRAAASALKTAVTTIPDANVSGAR